MTWPQFLLFLPACFALNMAFGPNNLLSVTYGARHGLGAAVRAGLGRLVAFALMITISGIGMGSLLMASETAFNAVKWLGAAYLVWLGIKLLRAPAPQTDQPTLVGDGPAGASPAGWALARQEFAVAVGNPKAILIFTAFLPQFTVPQHYVLSYVEVAVAFLVLEVAAIALYALLGMRMARSAGQGRIMRWFNKASGTMMVCFGVVLALMRRPGA